MDNKCFDVAVLGAGPGGYVAAIKAAQLGKKVICIDKSNLPGGTCLNVGCIPSKSLLASTHKYYEAAHHFNKYGITFDNLSFSLDKIMNYKDKVVQSLGNGIKSLFRKNKIEYIQGQASFTDDPHKINIIQNNNAEIITITAKNIIIATGSQPVTIPNITIDEKLVLSSTGALELKQVPRKMIIVGGGVIGLEMGSIWSRLGSKVSILEYHSSILGAVDDDVSQEMQRILTKQSIEFLCNSKITSCTEFIKENEVTSKSLLRICYEDVKNGEKKSIDDIDVLLVAVGRKPYTCDLGLDKIGIETTKSGQIKVDQQFRTKFSHIYAIGDVIEGPMLAHKASEEGISVAEIISGQKPKVNYNNIPNITYTYPEIATVGKNEKELIANNIKYKVGKFPFSANSRSKINDEIDGFVKILADAETDEILGAAIINPVAGEMIQEIVIGMELEVASEDIARTIHAHPGLSEAIKEASYAVISNPIHICQTIIAYYKAKTRYKKHQPRPRLSNMIT